MSFHEQLRRELEAMGPDRAQLEDLLESLSRRRAGPQRRRPVLRIAAVLAIAAVLVVGAVAAGPAIWSVLTGKLGPFQDYLTTAQGAVTAEGVEVALVGSLSDGTMAKVYFTATDQSGSRFNQYTQVSAQLEGALSHGGTLGCQVLSCEEATGQLLVEASAKGLGEGGAVTLEVSRFDPGYRYMESAQFQPPALAQVLRTQPGVEGLPVLTAGQTPQVSPDTADFSISSMGFDPQGGFHIRLAMAEGFSNSALLAVPYNADGAQMGSTLKTTAVPDGVDCLIGGIGPEDVAAIEVIRVYGAYRGPEEPIQGTWTLPVTLEPAQQRVLTIDQAVGPYWLERATISPLSVSVQWRRLDGQQSHPSLQVTLRGGERAGLGMTGGSGGQDGCYDFWLFTQPVELEDIASLTIAGETFPLSLAE